MAIRKFQLVDKFRGWTLNEVSFSTFNLLVGISGVGKTRILQSLQSVRQAGLFDASYANGCNWTLELESEGMKFLWEAETSLVAKVVQLPGSDEDAERQSAETPCFIRECIVRDDEVVLVARSEDKFLFNGVQLPKLKNTESAITLLRDEESIAPINRTLSRFVFSEHLIPPFAYMMMYNAHRLSQLRERYHTLDALREATGVPTLLKAYILQEDYPDEFQRIKDDYSEIFAPVSDVRLGKLSELDSSGAVDALLLKMDRLVLGVKEGGVHGWITNQRISSGMLRILVHLIELAMAPPGTVIMIDEIENSLGVNCLPELTDRFLEHSSEIQFILTSHHPYVINNVPSNRWKIVTRRGSTVTVLDADSIPALKTASAHEKFILLMNTKEYEEGIQ